MRKPETQTALPAGRVVKVRGRPKDYLAHVERVDYGKITVRPIAGQGMTTRARSVWRDTITEMEHQQ